MSEGNDIGFGVFRRTSDERQKAGEMVEVVTSERVNSHMVPEDGSIVCDTPGTCKLTYLTHPLTRPPFLFTLERSLNSLCFKC